MACHIPLESFRHCFASDLMSIEGLQRKLWALKVVGVSKQNAIWMWPLWRGINYYKGEGGGFPQVQAVVNLVNLSCPWLILAPKVLQLCINHLVLVLCKSVWIVEACQFFLVPSWSFNMPLYLSKMLRAKECASIPAFPMLFVWDSHLGSLKELRAH